jgi:TrmH family RNA methyltransferase
LDSRLINDATTQNAMVDRVITSLQNPRVKDAIRLRSARHRHKQQRFLIDGARELARAIAAGVPLVESFVCESLCASPKSRLALNLLRQTAGELWQVNEAVFAKLAFGERAEGVLAVAQLPQTSLDRLQPRGPGPIAVIEGVEKPGNVGAILRSADAAGVSAVLVADPATDLYNPNCIRASLGAVFGLPLCVTTSAAALEWLRRRGMRMFAARVDGQLDYAAADLSGAVAIILGSEAEGLSPPWQAADVTAIRLPMAGVVDSLNVSATAAVLFYESLRQRTAQAK